MIKSLVSRIHTKYLRTTRYSMATVAYVFFTNFVTLFLDQTAKMVQDALHPKIFQSPEFATGNIEDAIKKGFEEMDKEVVEAANLQNAMHGCMVH